VKEIPYYVSDKFLRTYYRDRYQLAQVERMVENSYEQYLVDECKNQKEYKVRLERAAKAEKNIDIAERKRKAAAEYQAARCIELDDLFPDSERKRREMKRQPTARQRSRGR
jgi:hypothetical protein